MKKDNLVSTLDNIALKYHTNENIPDIHIENLCQVYFIKWLINFLKENNYKKILELGYGDGIVTQALSDENLDLTVLEGSSVLCNKLLNNHKGVNCINTLFEDYYPEEKYECILAAHVLEHVENPVELLEKFSDWLTPTGKLIIVVPNRNSFHRKLAVKMKLQKKLDDLSERDKLVGHLRVYSLIDLEQDVINSGLNVDQKKGFFVKFLPNSMMLNFSDDLINALNEISDCVQPELAANLCIVASLKK